MNKRKTSNFSGITLISLVVTIIVLLILVGITLSTLTGDKSIIKHAGEAKERTSLIEANEKLTLAYIKENIRNKGNISLENVLEGIGYEYKVGGDSDNVGSLKITEDVEGTKEITGSISMEPSTTKKCM